MSNITVKGAVLFLLSGLLGAVVIFLLSMSVMDIGNAAYSTTGISYTIVILVMSLLVAFMLIYLLEKLIFKSGKILTPLFLTLSAFYTLIALSIYDAVTATKISEDIMFLFLYLPTFLLLAAWLYYAMSVFAMRIYKRR